MQLRLTYTILISASTFIFSILTRIKSNGKLLTKTNIKDAEIFYLYLYRNMKHDLFVHIDKLTALDEF